QGWQITLPAWDATPGATNLYKLSITIVDEKGHQATSNEVEIKVGQQRLGKLDMESATSQPASGLATDVMKLAARLEDHQGRSVNDGALTARWVATNAATGVVVPLVTGAACPVDAQNAPVPCLRVTHEQVDVRNGVNHYVQELVSTLAGTFIITTDFAAYGVTNPQTVTFTSTGSVSAVVRAEIQDPAGVDLLTTGNHPLVGVMYTVKLFDAVNADITASIPAATVHWMLDGPNTAGCNITLNSHDTGVTGYTFTPRVNANSNSGVICGDQGFGLKVTW
ncbi:murein transglycosylase, partial [Yersinia intermedia]|nr:murein transglycosylase [Yersinia intermedia]